MIDLVLLLRLRDFFVTTNISAADFFGFVVALADFTEEAIFSDGRCLATTFRKSFAAAAARFEDCLLAAVRALDGCFLKVLVPAFLGPAFFVADFLLEAFSPEAFLPDGLLATLLRVALFVAAFLARLAIN